MQSISQIENEKEKLKKERDDFLTRTFTHENDQFNMQLKDFKNQLRTLSIRSTEENDNDHLLLQGTQQSF